MINANMPDIANLPALLKGRYRLTAFLGRGNMASVYRAYDEMLKREVAIKVLMPRSQMADQLRDRFLREARAIARLIHPHIMTLHDADHDGPWQFLVLEHIGGQTLNAAQIARGGTFPLGEALGIARGILEALKYAHGEGVIHRDIKPENIMLTTNGQVKVTDFGLALLQDDMRLTEDGLVVGTLLYVAPEQLAGQGVDMRADLYSVGAVLYELLIGTPPHTGDTFSAVIANVLNAPPPSPRAVNAAIPPAVERLIQTLLAKHPAERYASADEALTALHAVLNAEREAAPSAGDELEQALLLHTVREEASSALESERRRLAAVLIDAVIEPLNLLLAQAVSYEQSLSGNPQARMAASVIASLARQVVQQARDLEANLHPTVLESLGLEPALESLSTQVTRSSGLQIELKIERLRDRLPIGIELALFRLAQDALTRAVLHARASRVSLRLELAASERRLVFTLRDNGTLTTGLDLLDASKARLQQFGATFDSTANPNGGLNIQITLPMALPAQLTSREVEVLRYLAEGLSNKEIAKRLSLSPRTVNFHLDNVYSKLGVNSRTEAVIYALRYSWLVRRPG